MACVAWRGEDEQEEAPTVTRVQEEAPTVTREVCQGYAFLRAGKDLCVLKDRTRYSMAVMTMRIGK